MTLAADQGLLDDQTRNVGGDTSPVPPLDQTLPTGRSVEPDGFQELRVLADCFYDIQQARIAITNRTCEKTLRDGTTIPPVVHPEVLASTLAAFVQSEKHAGTAMRACFRRVAPEIHAWVKATPGLGDHLVARLLGAIGDPVLAQPYHWEGEGEDRVLIADEPFMRNVGKLWALCGHGDPSRRRRKGMTAADAAALGNPRAKMLTRLIAEGCMKCAGGSADNSKSNAPPTVGTDSESDPMSGSISTDVTDALDSGGEATHGPNPVHHAPRRRSPYRDVYDRARLIYAQREDWTDGHRNNAALRLVGKEFLRDLWLVAQGREPLVHHAADTQVLRGSGSESEELA